MGMARQILFGTTVQPAKPKSGIRWTQCQAQLLNQFSVWVPPVTRLKRLTLGPRARAGHSSPGRGCCAPPAPKKSWGRPPSLPTIQIGRATIVERLVRPLGVIEAEIAGQPLARLAWTAIIRQIDFLIFHTAPQALGEDVVQCAP